MDLWTCVPARDYPNYGNEDRKNINEGGSPLWGRIPWIGVLDCLNRKGGLSFFLTGGNVANFFSILSS